MSKEVETLIQQELANIDMAKLHPSITPLPKSQNPNIPDEPDSDFTYGGIDVSKYSEINDESLALSTVYTLFMNESLSIAKEVNEEKWEETNEVMRLEVSEIKDLVETQNRKIDGVGNKRRKLVNESRTTLKYLEERRLEALKKIVEIKAESIKVQLGE